LLRVCVWGWAGKPATRTSAAVEVAKPLVVGAWEDREQPLQRLTIASNSATGSACRPSLDATPRLADVKSEVLGGRREKQTLPSNGCPNTKASNKGFSLLISDGVSPSIRHDSRSPLVRSWCFLVATSAALGPERFQTARSNVKHAQCGRRAERILPPTPS
jgi:hypothetical protein